MLFCTLPGLPEGAKRSSSFPMTIYQIVNFSANFPLICFWLLVCSWQPFAWLIKSWSIKSTRLAFEAHTMSGKEHQSCSGSTKNLWLGIMEKDLCDKWSSTVSQRLESCVRISGPFMWVYMFSSGLVGFPSPSKRHVRHWGHVGPMWRHA